MLHQNFDILPQIKINLPLIKYLTVSENNIKNSWVIIVEDLHGDLTQLSFKYTFSGKINEYIFPFLMNP